jgi:pyridoxal phosphate enzyme (YggS family)
VTEITDHLAEIRERVARAAERAGRSPANVTLVAVSKQQPPAAIAAAHRAGVTHFGESYVQEALPKMAALADLAVVWHFIGKVQANKTRQIAERFAWVHTVDRVKIAERLSEQRPAHAPPLNVLIQVNQAGETQRGGALPADVAELVRATAKLPRLHVRGLMTLPPHDDTPAKWFTELAALRARLAEDGVSLDTLSMGMSADFAEAVAAGATHLRIGTALFGHRAT